jgi:hypothetical protein
VWPKHGLHVSTCVIGVCWYGSMVAPRWLANRIVNTGNLHQGERHLNAQSYSTGFQ